MRLPTGLSTLAALLVASPHPSAQTCRLIADVNGVVTPVSGSPGSSRAVPGGTWLQGFAKCGPYWFFTANTVKDGRELWRTDGTPAGTMLVKDINPGSRAARPISTSRSPRESGATCSSRLTTARPARSSGRRMGQRPARSS